MQPRNTNIGGCVGDFHWTITPQWQRETTRFATANTGKSIVRTYLAHRTWTRAPRIHAITPNKVAHADFKPTNTFSITHRTTRTRVRLSHICKAIKERDSRPTCAHGSYVWAAVAWAVSTVQCITRPIRKVPHRCRQGAVGGTERIKRPQLGQETHWRPHRSTIL